MFVFRRLAVFLIKPNKHKNEVYYLHVAYQLNCRYLANHTTYATHCSYRFLIPGLEFNGNGLLTHILVYLPDEYQQDICNNINNSTVSYKSLAAYKSIAAYKPKDKYIIKQINMYNHKYVYCDKSVIYDMWVKRIEYKVRRNFIDELNAQFKYIQI